MANADQVTLLYIVEHQEKPRPGSEAFLKKFNQVITIHKVSTTPIVKYNLAIPYSLDSDLVTALNQACLEADSAWVLLVWADEDLNPSDLEKINLDTRYGYPGLIKSDINDGRYNYEIRLLPVLNESGLLFAGSTIPDATKYFHEHHLNLADEKITVSKDASFIGVDKLRFIAARDARQEMDWYWKGVFYTDQRKFALAERAFKKALEGNKLLIFYYLSALNGLANAQVELKKLDEAGRTISLSLDAEHHQFAPYLIQHKIYWLQGDWQNAYDQMEQYLSFYGYGTRANMDFFLDLAQAHFILAELSLVLKSRENAYRHFKKFYDLNQGNVSYNVLERLFVYSIELEKKEEALKYFRDLFSGIISEHMNESDVTLVLESVSLFEEKGWDDLANEIYEELFEFKPNNESLKYRRLITFMRSDQLDKARQAASDWVTGN